MSGTLVHFRHRDARSEPKRRPGVVDSQVGDSLTLFYGSRFKTSREPVDAIEVDPSAPKGTSPRDLADYLGSKFVRESTFFHGSLVSESHVGDPMLERISGPRFPSDPLDLLRRQGRDRLVAFLEAWQRLAWLSVPHRIRLLDALWWRLDTDPETETLLTLVLCDGWKLPELKRLRWSHLDLDGKLAKLGDRTRALLPRTAGLLEALPRSGVAPFDPELLEHRLERGWSELVGQASRDPWRVFPSWEELRLLLESP
ncbi:hypothetical protein ACNOYE_19265 [Nannocystaceae bacterium ST9]